MGTLEPRDVAGELEEGPNIFGITFKTSWTLMESTSPTVCKKKFKFAIKVWYSPQNSNPDFLTFGSADSQGEYPSKMNISISISLSIIFSPTFMCGYWGSIEINTIAGPVGLWRFRRF